MAIMIRLVSFVVLLSLICIGTTLLHGKDDNIECLDNGMCISKPETRAPQVQATARAVPSNTDTCDDRHDECAAFASLGHCDHHPGWMIVNCPRSCNSCHLRDHRVGPCLMLPHARVCGPGGPRQTPSTTTATTIATATATH